jgi:hypothetical protein
MESDAWISEEPQPTAVVTRVLARAARRGGLVLLVSLAGTVALVAFRAARPPTYVATTYFRLAESEVSDTTAGPRPPRAIREYIAGVTLTRDRLRRIMQAHGWSTGFLARDPVRAVEEFREEIGIEVNRNYFIYDRAPDDAPRTAHVSISLKGSDVEGTRAVLHDIGETILREQAEHRHDRLAQGRTLVEEQLRLAKDHARDVQIELAGLRSGARPDRPLGAATGPTRIAVLQAEALGATERVVALEKRLGELSFAATAENASLGLTFERYDESVVPVSAHLTPRQLAYRAVAVFAILFLLSLPAVGAFDERVYSPADLVERGLTVFGAIPRFAGDEAASFRDRSKARGTRR